MLLPKKRIVRNKALYNEYREINQGVMCFKCEYSLAVDIHHIIKKSQGGGDNWENLIPLCRPCHDRAHGKNARAERILLQIIKEG